MTIQTSSDGFSIGLTRAIDLQGRSGITGAAQTPLDTLQVLAERSGLIDAARMIDIDLALDNVALLTALYHRIADRGGALDTPAGAAELADISRAANLAAASVFQNFDDAGVNVAFRSVAAEAIRSLSQPVVASAFASAERDVFQAILGAGSVYERLIPNLETALTGACDSGLIGCNFEFRDFSDGLVTPVFADPCRDLPVRGGADGSGRIFYGTAEVARGILSDGVLIYNGLAAAGLALGTGASGGAAAPVTLPALSVILGSFTAGVVGKNVPTEMFLPDPIPSVPARQTDFVVRANVFPEGPDGGRTLDRLTGFSLNISGKLNDARTAAPLSGYAILTVIYRREGAEVRRQRVRVDVSGTFETEINGRFGSEPGATPIFETVLVKGLGRPEDPAYTIGRSEYEALVLPRD